MKRNLLPLIMLVAMMLCMYRGSGQSISYNSSSDLSGGATYIGNASVASEETQPYGLIFNDNGTKVYTIGYTADAVNQYTLTTPFDVTAGISHDGSFVGSDTSPNSVNFNEDGSKLYIMGFGSNSVHQYSLSVKYDITSTVTFEGSFNAGLNPITVVFSPDGTSMFTGSFNGNLINQYSLSTPYDITSTVTFVASSPTLGSFYDFRFSADGKTLLLLNFSSQVETYYLETAFDLSSTITKSLTGSLSGGSEGIARAMTLSADGSNIYILGQSTDAINQFSLNPGVFSEAISNNGSIHNPITGFALDGDLFTNAGGTLTHNTDYQITNLPAGLGPVFEVSSDGTHAQLTLNGQATNNQDIDDVASLTFNFMNSAFVSGNAASVSGATSASSGISIDFRDNSTPLLAYGAADVSSLSFSGTALDISGVETAPTGMAFNGDGSRLFIVGSSGDAVVEYSLPAAYDITGATATGNTYDISGDEAFAEEISFNPDGTRMFILGQGNDAMIQYSLSTPYDLTSTVTNQGTFSVASETISPGGFTFSPDGLTLYVLGFNTSDDTHVYSLTNPYDITSGVSLAYTANTRYGDDITFSEDGKMVYFTYFSAIYAYSTETPFYLGLGLTSEGTFTVSGEGTSAHSMLISPDRSKLLVLSATADVVNQYDLNTSFFEESFDDNGAINGSMTISVVDDQFTNAGGTLTHGVDFTVNNIPSGLTPVLSVANDGLSGELTLTGNATNHAQANDLNDLTFTFANSAFVGGDASSVLNASSASSYYRIEHKELEPILYSSSGYDVTALAVDGGPADISGASTSPGGIDFNNDGSKLFIADGNGSVVQYSLTVPYDINGGLTLDGTYTTTEESSPIDLALSNDGTKLFVIGIGGDKVNQYSLSTPFDILSTVTHEGDVAVTNGISVTFSSDGSRMYTTRLSSSQVTTWLLNEAFDLTQGYSTDVVSAGAYRDPVFSPDGRAMFATNSSNDRIIEYLLSEPFDISTVVASGNTFYVGTEDLTPLGLAISPDGTTFVVAGASADELNQYKITGGTYSEVAANSGAVDGSAGFTLRGDAFVNAGGNLTESTHYTITGVPAGLTAQISISADGSSASLDLTGNATNHQDVDDVDTDLAVSFLNAAFTGADASAIRNSSISEAVSFDFNDNGAISFVASSFYETSANNGTVTGSLRINLSTELFASAGALTEGDDYQITGVPAGLTPSLTVHSSRTYATLTFSGQASPHDDAQDVADLGFTFENSAFAASEAAYVDNAIGASSGAFIDFDDTNLAIQYGLNPSFLTTPDSVTSWSIVSEEDSPYTMAFSADGLKMFVLGFTNETIYQYNLTNPYDLTTGVSYSGVSLAISESSIRAILFSADGTSLFIGTSTRVNQYSLSVPFDISSTVTDEGEYITSGEDSGLQDIAFSRNGRKLYMIGSNNDFVYQYTLSRAFDVISGVTYDGSYFVGNVNWTGIQMAPDGENLYLSNGPFPGGAFVRQYNLNAANDITAGMSQVSSFSTFEIQSPSDFYLDPNNQKLFILGASDDVVIEFDLASGGFDEVTLNDGEVSGSMNFQLLDETFTNAGGTLTHTSDYTINNLPNGLTPSLTVDGGGKSASLTLSGKAIDHQKIDGVELEFTFANSAFNGGDASIVSSATAFNSGRRVDFNDNNPLLLYGDVLNPAKISYSGNSLDISAQDGYHTGISFNTDGSRAFIAGYDNNLVREYSLSDSYSLSGTVSYTGNALDISVNAQYPEDMYLSPDGTRLFISSSDQYEIVQYNLSTPFDLTTGAYSGNSLDLSTLDQSIYSLTFKADGSKMYFEGSDNETVYQYNLSTSFDLSTATLDGMLYVGDQTGGVGGLTFSADGQYLLIADDGGNQLIRYVLSVPFDVTSGAFVENTFDISNESTSPSALVATPNGETIWIINQDFIHQYNVDLGGFTETAANNGVLEGTANFYMIDEVFANAGGSLTHGVDYTIHNLPAEFTPSLAVAADGYSASLTLSGVTSNHGNAADLPSLQFTFNNSAFVNYPSNEVTNATNYSAAFGLDFTPYAENDIESFTFTNIDGSTTIDAVNHTVTAQAVAGTDLSAITPSITVSINAGVTPNSGVVQDFSTTVNYTVTAEDGTPQIWAVTITEALAAPTDIILSSSSIDENQSVGTSVGLLSSVDASFNDSHSYSLVAGTGDDDNASFSISGNDLQSAVIFDFETKSSYTIRVQTNDGNGGLFDRSLTITVNDINDDPSDISLSNNTIDESNPIGTTIGALSTTDEDAGQSHTYQLVAGTGDTDNASFTILGSDLQSAEIFDFETKTNYSVRVQTDDGNGGVFEKVFSISIQDIPPSVTSLDLSSSSVDENLSIGTAVGTLTTTGEELTGSFTYTLVAGSGDTDNGSFSITGDQLLTGASFDFESKSGYAIRVRTDDGNGGTFEQEFTISVNDVNEAPTDIALSNSSIDESNPTGTLIGSFTTTDEDGGQSHTYQLVVGTGDTDNASFSISGNNLQSAEIFDFETKTSYSVRIETNDGNGGVFEEAFTIAINDLPAQITSLTLSNSVIDENIASGSTVGDFFTFGEDLSGSFTYTLVAGAGDTDNTSFTISGNQLLTNSSVDFESKSSYSLRVMTDDGIGNTLEQIFAITVNDISEAPTDLLLSNSALTENNSVNDVIGMFRTTDEDAGETYTYSLVSGTGDSDNGSFNIDGSNLRAGEIFDFETKSSYSIRVRTDDGNGGVFEKAFSISISDVNEQIVLVSPLSDLNLNEGFGSREVDLSGVFSDPDGDAITYDVSSSNTSIVSAGVSGTTVTIVEAGFGSSTITVTADDGSGVTTSDDFVVTVTEVFSTETDIVSFSLSQQTGSATINATAHTVDIEVARGTDVTGLNPSITVSAGATYSPAGGQNFANGTVEYTVIAEDGSTTQVWSVTVAIAPNMETDIVTFALAEQTSSATINANDHTVEIEVAAGTGLTNLEPSITLSDGATISPAGPQDFTGAVTYTVTAEDGVTTQDWAVTVTEKALGLEDEIMIKVYPNPVTDFLNIQTDQSVTVRLTDLNGRIMKERKGADLRLDLRSVREGVYLLTILKDGKKSTRTIIKAN